MKVMPALRALKFSQGHSVVKILLLFIAAYWIITFAPIWDKILEAFMDPLFNYSHESIAASPADDISVFAFVLKGSALAILSRRQRTRESVARAESFKVAWDEFVEYHGYCVRPFLIRGDRPSSNRITLTLHGSASAIDLEYISLIISNWNAPMSVAIYIQSFDNDADRIKELFLSAMRHASNQDAARFVNLHVLYKKHDYHPCDGTSPMFQKASLGNQTRAYFRKYPINLVRNVARKYVQTQFQAMADVDFLFSANFEPKMRAIAQKTISVNPKTALVYRIFEIDEQEILDRNGSVTKTDLQLLFRNGQARTFHGQNWWRGHGIPQLIDWLQTPESETPGIFNISLSQRYRDRWEPQIVVDRNIPYFDETFPYRQKNNIELRWELCRAGYELRLVEDLFVFHRIVPTSKRDNEDEKIETAMTNYFRYRRAEMIFRQRMLRQYPETLGLCPI